MQFVSFQMCDSTSTPPQAPLPLGKCFVYLTGTATLAQLYDGSGSPISNPVTADTNAMVGFAAADGIYDFQFAYPSGTPAGPKVLKQQIFDSLGVHGVIGTSVSDDPGLTAALAALPAAGGAIGLTAQVTRATAINLDSKHNVLLNGYSGGGAGGGNPPLSEIIFTGTGSTGGISAAHGEAVVIRDMGIRYNNAFTSDLIAFINTTGGSDAAYCGLDRVIAGGDSTHYGARSVVSMEGGIINAVLNSHLFFAQVGLRCSKQGGLYSNAELSFNTTYNDHTVMGISDFGQGCASIADTFEGTNGGSGGMPCAIGGTLTSSGPPIAAGNVVLAPWIGDWVNVSTVALAYNNNTTWRGWLFGGGYWDSGGTGKPCLKFTATASGIGVIGASMSTGIDCGSVDIQAFFQVGCYVGTNLANLSAGSEDIGSLCNKLDGGFADNTLRLYKIKEWRIGGRATNVAGGPGIFAYQAPASTDLNFWLNGDAATNRLINFASDGTPRAKIGLDTSNNFGLITYTSLGAFVGYAVSVNPTTMDATLGGHVLPAGDNAKNLGSAGQRWGTVYAGTGTINTSDLQHKEQIRSLADPEFDTLLDAVGAVRTVAFKFKDAVAAKGDQAREHYGVIAQELHDELVKRGLDPFAGGFLGRDPDVEIFEEEYEAQRQVTKPEKVKRQQVEMVKGKHVRRTITVEQEVPQFKDVPLYDERGKKVMTEAKPEKIKWRPGETPLSPPVRLVIPAVPARAVMHTVPVMETYTATRRVTRAKVDAKGETIWIWNMRYEEFLVLRSAWLEREMTRGRAGA